MNVPKGRSYSEDETETNGKKQTKRRREECHFQRSTIFYRKSKDIEGQLVLPTVFYSRLYKLQMTINSSLSY